MRNLRQLIRTTLIGGVLARSAWAKKTREKLDAVLYQLVPGYAVVRGVISGIDDSDYEQSLRPVLVRLDDQLQIAFEVERIAGGFVAVFSRLPRFPLGHIKLCVKRPRQTHRCRIQHGTQDPQTPRDRLSRNLVGPVGIELFLR